MDRVKLVPMQQRHIPEIARLERMCFSQPWSEEGLRAELTDSTAYFVAAEQQGQLVGYAGMHGICGEGYIANIAVFPAMRSKGIGRMLVRALLEYAQSKKWEFLSLEVRPSNTAAVSLYRSEGFQEVGRRKRFYTAPTEDGLIMTRYFHSVDNA